ncbi:MAG: hypothetical protein ABIH23_20510 [bacterium]
MNFLKKILGAVKGLVFQIIGVELGFGSGTGPLKKEMVLNFLKKAIGVGESIAGKDIMDEGQFVAGLDQAVEGLLRALKATSLWPKEE